MSDVLSERLLYVAILCFLSGGIRGIRLGADGEKHDNSWGLTTRWKADGY